MLFVGNRYYLTISRPAKATNACQYDSKSRLSQHPQLLLLKPPPLLFVGNRYFIIIRPAKVTNLRQYTLKALTGSSWAGRVDCSIWWHTTSYSYCCFWSLKEGMRIPTTISRSLDEPARTLGTAKSSGRRFRGPGIPAASLIWRTST